MSEFPYIFPVRWQGDITQAFAPFAQEPGAFFLDATASGRNATCNKRYSFFGWNPLHVFSSSGGFITIDGHTTIDTPADALRRFAEPLTKLPSDAYLPFYSGLVGFVGHEWALISTQTPLHRSSNDIPDAWFGMYDTVVVYDHIEETLSVVSMGLDTDLHPQQHLAETRARQVADALIRLNKQSRHRSQSNHSDTVRPIPPTSDLTTYQAIAQALHQQLLQSDCQKINLAQRFQAVVQRKPWDIHVELRASQDVAYATYIHGDGFFLMSTSPTSFVQIHEQSVQLRPVVSTLPVSADTDEYTIWQEQITANTSSDACVQTCRQQLATFCPADSIQISPIHFSHDARNHYANVLMTARAKPDSTVVDALTAMLPSPFLTGQPCNTALELLQHEPVRRNAYGGAIGYWSAQGDAQFCLALRLMTIKDSVAYLHAANWLNKESDPASVVAQTTQQVSDFFQKMGTFTQRY